MNNTPTPLCQSATFWRSGSTFLTSPRTWFGVFAFTTSCGALLAESTPPVTVKVAVDSSNDYKNIAGSAEKSKKQTRQLNISLGNNDKDVTANLTVKWAIYSHTMKDHKLVTAKAGTSTAKVESFKTVTVSSAKVTIEGTPEHTVVTKKSNRGKPQVSSKRNPATGEDYYGYAVAVYSGSTLIEETASHPSLKLDK